MLPPLVLLLAGAESCTPPACHDYKWESETEGDELTVTGEGALLSTLDTSMCSAEPEARRFHQAAFFNTLPEDGLLWIEDVGGGCVVHGQRVCDVLARRRAGHWRVRVLGQLDSVLQQV